jgi:hypothetical protein
MVDFTKYGKPIRYHPEDVSLEEYQRIREFSEMVGGTRVYRNRDHITFMSLGRILSISDIITILNEIEKEKESSEEEII